MTLDWTARRRIVAALVAAMLASAAVAYAAPGELDPTFGDGGTVILEGPDGYYFTYSGGRISSVDFRGPLFTTGTSQNSQSGSGAATVVRKLRPDGRLDRSFSADGERQWYFRKDGENPRTLTYWQSALLGGGVQISGYFTRETFGQGESWYVARFLPNGHLDDSYSSNGISRRKFVETLPTIQPDGSADGCYRTEKGNLRVWRDKVDGSPDGTFGKDGIARIVLPDDVYAGGLEDCERTASGGVAIVARGDPYDTLIYTLVLLTASGKLDTTLDGDGIAVIATPIRTDYAAIHPDGSVYFSGDRCEGEPGAWQCWPAVYALRPDGKPDLNYGGGDAVADADHPSITTDGHNIVAKLMVNAAKE